MEGQLQEFEERDTSGKRRQLTPTQLELRRRREVLLLSRARVDKDLQSARDPRYKEQLNRALADLDSQLAALKDAG